MKEDYAGALRLQLEIGDEEKRKQCIDKYVKRVEMIKEELQQSGVKIGDEETFFRQIGMYCPNAAEDKDMIDDFLSTKLDGGKWDCDTLTFLVFDVAQTFGLNVRFVIIGGHTFLITEKGGYYEPTTGEYYLKKTLHVHFQKRYYEGTDLAMLQAITYNVIGTEIHSYPKEKTFLNRLKARFGMDRKLKLFDKAIQLIPIYATAHHNKAERYSWLEMDAEAIKNYSTAIEMDPEYTNAYLQRGRKYMQNSYYQKPILQKAIDDFEKYLEIRRGVSDSEVRDVYLHLWQCYDQIGNKNKADFYWSKRME